MEIILSFHAELSKNSVYFAMAKKISILWFPMLGKKDMSGNFMCSCFRFRSNGKLLFYEFTRNFLLSWAQFGMETELSSRYIKSIGDDFGQRSLSFDPNQIN